jgi:hypothetical protein
MTWKPFTTLVCIGARRPRRTNSDTALPTVISRLFAYVFTWGRRSSSSESVVRIADYDVISYSLMSRTIIEHQTLIASISRSSRRSRDIQFRLSV